MSRVARTAERPSAGTRIADDPRIRAWLAPTGDADIGLLTAAPPVLPAWLDELIADLDSADTSVRAAALSRLDVLSWYGVLGEGEKAVLAAVTRAWLDGRVAHRAQVIAILRRAGPAIAAVTPDVGKRLRSERPAEALAALALLSGNGGNSELGGYVQPLLPDLLRASAHENADVRLAAAGALSWFAGAGNDEALGRLAALTVAASEDDGNPAAWALSQALARRAHQIPDDVLSILREASESRHSYTRITAWGALVDAIEYDTRAPALVLGSLLAEERHFEPIRVSDARLNEFATALLEKLPQQSPEARLRGVRALCRAVRNESPLVQPLRDLLVSDVSAPVRDAVATWGLASPSGTPSDDRWNALALESMTSERLAALRRLAAMEIGPATAAAIARLHDDPDPLIAACAALVAAPEEPAAMPELVACLHTAILSGKAPGVEIAAAFLRVHPALVPGVREELATLLTTAEGSGVRRAAASALLNGDEECYAVVASAVACDDWSLPAYEAIEEAPRLSALAYDALAGHASSRVRSSVARASGRDPDPSRVLRFFDDASEEVRRAAFGAVVSRRDARLHRALVAALRSPDRSVPVRLSAARALHAMDRVWASDADVVNAVLAGLEPGTFHCDAGRLAADAGPMTPQVLDSLALQLRRVHECADYVNLLRAVGRYGAAADSLVQEVARIATGARACRTGHRCVAVRPVAVDTVVRIAIDPGRAAGLIAPLVNDPDPAVAEAARRAPSGPAPARGSR